MSNQKSITDRVLSVLAQHIGKDESEVKVDSRFADDLDMDSLDQLEFVMRLEEEFERDIDDGDAEKFVSPADVIAYLVGK